MCACTLVEASAGRSRSAWPLASLSRIPWQAVGFLGRSQDCRPDRSSRIAHVSQPCERHDFLEDPVRHDDMMLSDLCNRQCRTPSKTQDSVWRARIPGSPESSKHGRTESDICEYNNCKAGPLHLAQSTGFTSERWIKGECAGALRLGFPPTARAHDMELLLKTRHLQMPARRNAPGKQHS